MLGTKNAIATVAVKDLAAARKFYEGKLGLKLEDENSEVLTYKAGSSQLFVYHSEYAGTNQATGVTWNLDDVDGAVEALKAKGVTFERYDLPGMSHEEDVHVAGDLRNAWFKDPDGNIHSLVSG